MIKRASFLPLNEGAKNLHLIKRTTESFIGMSRRTLGTGFFGEVPAAHKDSALVREGLLNMLSTVLLHSPIKGTDGLPGARTYFASPMDSRFEIEPVIREIGYFIHPGRFDGEEISGRLVQMRELWKFFVRVPSENFGFSIDILRVGFSSKPIGLNTHIYDGGRALPDSNNALREVAVFSLFLFQKDMRVDLEAMNISHTTDIDILADP